MLYALLTKARSLEASERQVTGNLQDELVHHDQSQNSRSTENKTSTQKSTSKMWTNLATQDGSVSSKRINLPQMW